MYSPSRLKWNTGFGLMTSCPNRSSSSNSIRKAGIASPCNRLSVGPAKIALRHLFGPVSSLRSGAHRCISLSNQDGWIAVLPPRVPAQTTMSVDSDAHTRSCPSWSHAGGASYDVRVCCFCCFEKANRLVGCNPVKHRKIGSGLSFEPVRVPEEFLLGRKGG